MENLPLSITVTVLFQQTLVNGICASFYKLHNNNLQLWICCKFEMLNFLAKHTPELPLIHFSKISVNHLLCSEGMLIFYIEKKFRDHFLY